jgi:hypothetical protein
MNPEDRLILERTLKLSEENNKILLNLLRRARWATAWGFIKILLIIVPLVLGYIFLLPYFDTLTDSYKEIRAFL